MRLIKLTAFGGRLSSEIMEWPDWPPNIRMYFDRSPMGCLRLGKDIELPTEATLRTAIFERTGEFTIHNGQSVCLYALTGI